MKKEVVLPLGIDLGLTNTCAAVWWNDKVEIVVNELASRSTPSYYYYDGVEAYVGKTARDKLGTNPKNVYYDSRRMLAQTIFYPVIQKLKTEWTFEVQGNREKENLCEYVVNKNIKPLSPIIVSGEILKSIIWSAEKRFGKIPRDAVISIPPNFSNEQKKSTYDAAKYANLDNIYFIPEPIAAAIAYTIEQHKYKENTKLFIFNLDYEIFNASVVTLTGSRYKILVARGNICLGGRDFDHLIFEWMKKKLVEDGVEVEKLNQKKKFKIKIQSQAIKEALTMGQETLVFLSDIFETAKNRYIKRTEFEEMSKDLLKTLESECLKTLHEIKLKAKDIDHVLFVGGSSRMPMIAKMLKNIFHDEAKFSKVVNPDEVVAVGAAMFAANCLKASKKPEILNIEFEECHEMGAVFGLLEFANSGKKSDSRFIIPLQTSKYDLSHKVVGIDLGTTECCAAVIRKNGPECVQLDPITNDRNMPSYVAFDEAKPKCGQIVINRLRYKAAYSVYDLKRILGIPFEEIVIDSIWPFKVLKDNSDVKIEYQTFEGISLKTVEEALSFLLLHIKNVVEAFEGQNLTEAVIAIPANYTKTQIEATKIAAQIAGWIKIHFIPEPVAAAIAYCNENKIPSNSNILICDCGGGTLDICIAKVVENKLEILNCGGDAYLGGRDFDKLLFNHFSAILKYSHNIDVLKSSQKYLLKQKCQTMKHTLSATMEDWIDISEFNMEIEQQILIIRNEFEEMASDLLLRVKNTILRTLSEISQQPQDMNYIFHVGGGCRMPMIKKLLSDIFPFAQHRLSLHPDCVVAQGAALYSYHLQGDRFLAQN